MKFVSAQEYWDICKGETFYWNVAVNTTDTVIYFSSFTDSLSYLNNRVYDTIIGDILSATVDTDMIYEVVSVNGIIPVYQKMLVITILPVATISIPPTSIHHVTCPDGYLYPYMDGSFHVSLDNPIQDYDWIDIFNDSTYFSFQAHDSVTLTNLRAGTYHVVAYGINGCEYHDSVIIEQPEPWYWNHEETIVDTLKCGMNSGCITLSFSGGTSPLHYYWFFYDEQDSMIFFYPDTNVACGLAVGEYCVFIYDSKGCKLFGFEVFAMQGTIYELVTDTIHMESLDTTICPGQEIMLAAYSRGYGDHTWIVGNNQDSINYYTGTDPELGYMSMYFIDSLMESQYVTVSFVDENGCETSDSTWVEIYASHISLSIVTTTIVTDSSCTIHVSPPGGNLYLDEVPIAYNIPENFTFSTAGISVGEHMLKYSGIFGSEIGLACDDETSQTIQVETNLFVPNWEYNVSIYPNPATTTLNLSSTGTSDFDISVLDITGKVIKTERMLDQIFTFDVSDLESGMYMLRLVSTDGASKVVKFVKR